MAVEQNLPDLSTDLIIEIFSRLPSKSIGRFRCLSKQWASLLTIGSPYFTELFLTQSKTRPCLLFTIQGKDKEWYLYSCPQSQMSYKNSESSLSVTPEFHMSLHKSNLLKISAPILGLIYCSNMLDNSPMLCNPSTRNLLWLPEHSGLTCSYFGYDPINKQFSVLSIGYQDTHYQILKLGSGKLSWRNIECPLDHHALEYNTCINGVLYYIARFDRDRCQKIVCFDLNSEEFRFMNEPWSSHSLDLLVNFKGKLCGIYRKCVKFGKIYNIKLVLWILEDVEEQEWSKHVYFLPTRLSEYWYTKLLVISIVGVTATSEVVLSFSYTENLIYLYFFNLEKKTLHKVEIKGFEGFECSSFLQGCVDYVEDLKDLNCS